MSDLIERKDATKALYDAHFKNWGNAVMIIQDLPSAGRPKGEWIEVRAFDALGGDEAVWMAHGNPIAFHYCSECKEQTRLDEFGEEMLSKYCPDCGAKMKGADDE